MIKYNKISGIKTINVKAMFRFGRSSEVMTYFTSKKQKKKAVKLKRETNSNSKILRNDVLCLA